MPVMEPLKYQDSVGPGPPGPACKAGDLTRADPTTRTADSEWGHGGGCAVVESASSTTV